MSSCRHSYDTYNSKTKTPLHQRYRPDLARLTFIFLYPQKSFKRGNVSSNEKVVEAVREPMRPLPEECFTQGMRKLSEIWSQCFEKEGDYFKTPVSQLLLLYYIIFI